MRLTHFLTSLIFWALAFVASFAGDFDDAFRAGELARVRGEFDAATIYFQKALSASGNAGQIADAKIGLGHVAYIRAGYLDAIVHFRNAEKIAADAGDRNREALAWSYLGQLYWRVGKVDDGFRLLELALAAFEANRDDAGRALTLRFLGRLENGRPKPGTAAEPNNEVALKNLESALEIYKQIGDLEGELTTLKEIGIVHQTWYFRPGTYETARPYFIEVRDRTKNTDLRRLYALALNNLSANALELKDLALSAAYADEALTLFRAMGDDQEALEMLERKIRLASRDRKAFAKAEGLIDEAYELSLKLYSRTVGNAVDRRRYYDTMSNPTHWRGYFGVFHKRTGRVMEMQEEMRSVALIERIRAARAHLKWNLSEADAREGELLAAEIRRLNRISRPAVNNGVSDDLWRARLLKEEWDAKMAAKYEPPPTVSTGKSAPELCREITDSDSVVVKFDTMARYFVKILIVTRRPPVPFEFIDLDEMPAQPIEAGDGQPCTMYSLYPLGAGTEEDRAKSMRAFWEIDSLAAALADNLPAYRKYSRSLYDTLIAPIEPMIRGHKRLIVMPSGITGNIPFEALLSPSGRFLLEDYSISYAPTIGVLGELRRNAAERRGRSYEGDFFALGNPRLGGSVIAKQRARYRSKKLESLPEAASEARTIGAFFERGRVLTGAAATEAAWRDALTKYRYLHLATHGISDPVKPLYSHVLLGADTNEDGVVEGWEIASSKIDAEMVVLSACETARGTLIESEGMIGLAWSFQAAGVPTVIASRWKVDSATTSRQMIDFYKNLKLQNQPPTEALRTAALKIMKNRATSHPFYWAGFSVYGGG